jgi:hypothetical protein
VLREQDDLRRALERSSERVGVNPEDLQRVAAAALLRAGLVLDSARGEPVGNDATFRLNPADPAFARDAGWDDAFDDLRIRPHKHRERLGDWRVSCRHEYLIARFFIWGGPDTRCRLGPFPKIQGQLG